MRFAPYPRYRADDEGARAVPMHWDEKRLKYAASIVVDKADNYDPRHLYIGLENIASGGLAKLVASDEKEDVSGGVKRFKRGDVLFGKLRPYLAKGLDPDFDGQCSPELMVLRPTGSARFLRYLMLSDFVVAQVDASTYGTKMPRAAPDTIAGLRVPLPPPQEQRAIAAFLDRETEKIDALMAKQERLIELLEEKRQAAIAHAVTKGLDPIVQMKSSGVAWLGDVPSHWQITPLRAFFRFVKRQEQAPLEVLSVYREYGVIPKSSRDDNINKTPDDLAKYQTVRVGDLVVNKMKAWQGSLGVSGYIGITSPDYAVFEPLANHSRYIDLLLRCRLLPSVYRSISNGIRNDQWRLEPDKLRSLRLPNPPREEQDAIAAAIEADQAKATALTNRMAAVLGVLAEFRASLIAAAVTGKIDVRGRATSDAVDQRLEAIA